MTTTAALGMAGIVTLHLAFPGIFANFPERQQADVDGYIAVIDCGEMGNRYMLELAGHAYLVAVAACGGLALVTEWLISVIPAFS